MTNGECFGVGKLHFFIPSFVAYIFILSVVSFAGTPREAERIQKAYERSVEVWQLREKLGKNEGGNAQEKAPNPGFATQQMWGVIQGSLSEEWTLDPAAWYIQMVAAIRGSETMPEQLSEWRSNIAKIQESIEQHHSKSKKLTSICMALTAERGRRSQQILRNLAEKHPDKQVAGVAALGVAVIARSLGDDPAVMRERLTMLRKAIMDASEVKLGEKTVADLAAEELYLIKNLSKGVPAPELKGVDSGGREMKLSDYRGKIVMLIFWSAHDQSVDSLLEWVDKVRKHESFAGKSFEVVGVHIGERNRLRTLQAERRVEWRSFSDTDGSLGHQYRITKVPAVYILDGKGQIQFIGEMGTFAELTASALLSEL